jgi:hypothetical protein
MVKLLLMRKMDVIVCYGTLCLIVIVINTLSLGKSGFTVEYLKFVPWPYAFLFAAATVIAIVLVQRELDKITF